VITGEIVILENTIKFKLKNDRLFRGINVKNRAFPEPLNPKKGRNRKPVKSVFLNTFATSSK
jgi:hypothetical protein